MKATAALVLAASAALAAAQATYNETTGKFTCAKPGASYCAGDSLSTNIIIRCDDTGAGFPGNCNDNVSGEPPVGVLPASCYQTSNTSGDAACEKNCVVYAQPSFTLPSSVCQPSYTASSSTMSATSTATTTMTVSSSTLTTASGSGSGSSSGPATTSGSGNGTCHSCGGSSSTTTGSNTPVGPTTSTGPTTVATAGAAVHQVGGSLAVAGLVAAFFV